MLALRYAYPLAVALVVPGCAAKPPAMRPPAPAPALPEVPPEEQVSIMGVVTHSEKRRKLAGALVILQCECLAAPYEQHTDADGLYRYRGLPPGKYTVQVLHGMADVAKSMDVPPGAKFRANFWIDLKFRHPHFLPEWQRDWTFVDRGLLRDDRCENWPGLCQR